MENIEHRFKEFVSKNIDTNLLPNIDDAGVIALKVVDELEDSLFPREEAYFVAGFQEAIKYLLTINNKI